MAWRPEHPITLPDGRLVCSPHGLVICSYCTVDYSFMDELLAEDEEEDDDDDDVAETSDYRDSADDDTDNSNGDMISLGTELRVGTGRVFPTKFNPPNPNDTPKSLFPLGRSESASPPVDRFIRRNGENDQFLVYTDGACLDNGGQNPRAGCCFVYGKHGRYTSFPLEKKGTHGHRGPTNKQSG